MAQGGKIADVPEGASAREEAGRLFSIQRVRKRTDKLQARARELGTHLNNSGVDLMLINFDAQWFRSYSRAALESDPKLLRLYVPEA